MGFRRATAEDLPALLALVREMISGTPLEQEVPDAKIARIVVNPAARVELVEIDGKVVGFWAALVCEEWFGTRRKAQDLGIYVTPRHRGLRLFREMVMRLEGWALAMGAEEVWLGQSVGGTVDATRRLYERMGYECCGVNTRKGF